jgi:RHS repeat-associated protein
VSYTADALNRYTAVGAVSPTYDGNGNLTFDGTFTLGYDAENRLTSASGAGNTAAYAYDAQGRRKSRTVNGATTVFVTDAGNREVLEYDGASGAIQRWYAYALGPNEVLNQMNVAAGTRATLLPDILGSIIASQDSSSGALTKIGYLPYGKSASAGPFGFTGQRIDLETSGLYYYRARHYSPAWGRFLQVDPIGYSGGAHLYAYVGNDPLNLIDLMGLADSPVNYGYGYGANAQRAADNFSTGNYGAAIYYEALHTLDTAIAITPFGALENAATKGVTGAATGTSVWALGWATRGQAIEQSLGANLPSSFPVIDRFAGGTATSIKSIDLNATTYQNMSSLASRLNGYVDAIANFNGASLAGTEIRSSEITAPQLQLAIPSTGPSAHNRQQ